MVDLYIAGGLVGIVVIVYLLSRMKFITKKSLPYVVLGLLAALGFGYFKLRKRNKAEEEIKKLKEQINEKEKILEELKKKYTLDKKKLHEMEAEFRRHIAASEKKIALIEAKTEAEKERIRKMSDAEFFDDVMKPSGTG